MTCEQCHALMIERLPARENKILTKSRRWCWSAHSAAIQSISRSLPPFGEDWRLSSIPNEYNVPSQHESHFLDPSSVSALSGFRFHVLQAAISTRRREPDVVQTDLLLAGHSSEGSESRTVNLR